MPGAVPLMMAALVLIGCGDKPTEPAALPKTVTGTYVLGSVDGRSIPATVSRTTSMTIELVAGTLILANEWEWDDYYGLRIAVVGDFVVRSTLRQTENGAVSMQEYYEAFTYYRGQSSLAIRHGLYGEYVGTATISGNALVFLRNDGHSYSYRK